MEFKIQLLTILLIFCAISNLKSQMNMDFKTNVIPDNGVCTNWTTSERRNSSRCVKEGKTLICFGQGPDRNNSQYAPEKIEEITLCGWSKLTFDPHHALRGYRRVRILKIEHTNLTNISNDFPRMRYLENINISWTKFEFIRPTLFQKLRNLKSLDLRWNKIDHMDGPLILSDKFEQLYMSGNPWNCTRNQKWLLNHHKAAHVVDRDNLTCADHKYSGKHLLTVMQFKLNLKQECASHPEIRNCSCTTHYIRRSDDGKSLTPIFAVNCSNLQFYNFPTFLPENTSIFYATHNYISDIRPLRNIPIYKSVHDVYLDYNRVQAIDVLEAGFWLHRFRVLSIRGNLLTKLPVYALDNALEKNHHAAKLYLSLNPWRCDCKFTMKFRDLLMKYTSIIKDASNVTCNYVEGDKNSMAQVLSLQRTDLCTVPTESSIYPLDFVNGVLASLIVLTFGKLAYDYYQYKKSGKLPWIITKIP